MKVRFVTLDVFTEERFGGNPLAVIPDATGLDDGDMQRIAGEFNLSETTFVLPAKSADHTRAVRIFTPVSELPFAGHPTVGTAVALVELGLVESSKKQTTVPMVLEERVGPIPVTVRRETGRATFAQFTVAQLPEVGPPSPSRNALADLLSVDVEDMLGGVWSPQAVSCGVPYLFVPLRDRDAVARARIRLDRWEATLRAYWASKVFVFAREGERAGSDVHARMFAPSLGITEDPATGSAAAALAGYLGTRDATADGTLRWIVEQGFEMGRPSIMEVEADKVGGSITAVRVGGRAVQVSEGTMQIGND